MVVSVVVVVVSTVVVVSVVVLVSVVTVVLAVLLDDVPHAVRTRPAPSNAMRSQSDFFIRNGCMN